MSLSNTTPLHFGLRRWRRAATRMRTPVDTPAAGSRARPAGSCAVPPRVACAAAAAVGPGVVTGPARRDSTHRDAAHAACRPAPPLRGASRSAGPATTVDAAIGFEYCMRILNEQQVGVPIRRETESDLYVLAPTNPARDRRDGKYDTRSNPNITLPPRLPETTSGRARYPRTHLAVTPLTRAGRAADGRRAPRPLCRDRKRWPLNTVLIVNSETRHRGSEQPSLGKAGELKR